MRLGLKNFRTLDHPSARNSSLRRLGMVLVPLVFTESVLGLLSTGSHSISLLVAHIALGTGLVLMAVLCVVIATRLRSRRAARMAAWFTLLSIASTATTGAIFLQTGFAQAALIDRSFALAGLIGGCLMIVLGTGRVPEQSKFEQTQ